MEKYPINAEHCGTSNSGRVANGQQQRKSIRSLVSRKKYPTLPYKKNLDNTKPRKIQVMKHAPEQSRSSMCGAVVKKHTVLPLPFCVRCTCMQELNLEPTRYGSLLCIHKTVQLDKMHQMHVGYWGNLFTVITDVAASKRQYSGDGTMGPPTCLPYQAAPWRCSYAPASADPCQS